MSIIINGASVPDTDIVTSLLDNPKYSWKPGIRGADIRETPEIIVGHWTAGEAGTKTYDDDGPWVANVLKTRKGKDGKTPLRAGIDFVIGACDPNEPGLAPIWQCSDPAKNSTVHVGSYIVNRRAIGVEIVNMADPKHMLKDRPRVEKEVSLLGQKEIFLQYYPAQIRSWIWLCDTLTGVFPTIPRNLPMSKDGKLLTNRMTLKQAKNWKGIMEHYHMWNTTKKDAGSFLINALADEGYTLKGV